MNMRSFKKALTWKILSTSLALGVAYLLTGSTAAAVGIAAVYIPTSMILYMAHEAMWNKVSE